MVGVAGFEPTAFRSQSGRATKLRHTPHSRERKRTRRSPAAEHHFWVPLGQFTGRGQPPGGRIGAARGVSGKRCASKWCDQVR